MIWLNSPLDQKLQCSCRKSDFDEHALAWALLSGKAKSPCSSPFFSMNTTLCLLGWRWVLAIRLPEGLKQTTISVLQIYKSSPERERGKTNELTYFQQSACSRPLMGSLVACRTPSLFQTLTFLAPVWGQMALTAKSCPSPRHVTRGLWSSHDTAGCTSCRHMIKSSTWLYSFFL